MLQNPFRVVQEKTRNEKKRTSNTFIFYKDYQSWPIPNKLFCIHGKKCLGTTESIQYSISKKKEKKRGNLSLLLKWRTLVVILPTNNYCWTHISLELNLVLLFKVFFTKSNFILKTPWSGYLSWTATAIYSLFPQRTSRERNVCQNRCFWTT